MRTAKRRKRGRVGEERELFRVRSIISSKTNPKDTKDDDIKKREHSERAGSGPSGRKGKRKNSGDSLL